LALRVDHEQHTVSQLARLLLRDVLLHPSVLTTQFAAASLLQNEHRGTSREAADSDANVTPWISSIAGLLAEGTTRQRTGQHAANAADRWHARVNG
jgi:hypothetical protein